MTLARIARGTAVYMLLVGPPLGMLVAIVHFGSRLDAPRAIGGDWVVAAAPHAEPAGCPTLELGPAPLVLHVAQSGPRAQAVLSDPAGTKLSLELAGEALSGAEDPEGAACGLVLDARVVHADASDQLVGVLRRPRCTACADVPFQAVRRVKAKR